MLCIHIKNKKKFQLKQINQFLETVQSMLKESWKQCEETCLSLYTFKVHLGKLSSKSRSKSNVLVDNEIKLELTERTFHENETKILKENS